MSLMDIFDATTNGLRFLDEAGKKRPKLIIILYILLVPTLLWFVLELPYIVLLTSPFWFLSLSVSTGFIFSCLIAYLLWRRKIIDYYTPKSFFGLSVIICLLTLSLASFANRQLSTEINRELSKGGVGFELSKTVLSKKHNH